MRSDFRPAGSTSRETIPSRRLILHPAAPPPGSNPRRIPARRGRKRLKIVPRRFEWAISSSRTRAEARRSASSFPKTSPGSSGWCSRVCRWTWRARRARTTGRVPRLGRARTNTRRRLRWWDASSAFDWDDAPRRYRAATRFARKDAVVDTVAKRRDRRFKSQRRRRKMQGTAPHASLDQYPAQISNLLTREPIKI